MIVEVATGDTPAEPEKPAKIPRRWRWEKLRGAKARAAALMAAKRKAIAKTMN